MKNYLDLVQKILDEGVEKGDRTGTGTKSIFGAQLRWDLSKGFPLVTTKKVHFKSIVHELLWFISGNTNTKYLTDNGVTIWNEWADEKGNLGPLYGEQWRNWTDTRLVFRDNLKEQEKLTERGYRVIANTEEQHVYHKSIDQLAEAINLIKTDPNSRRIIVSAWNVGKLDDMALNPCHFVLQFTVTNGKLNLAWTQR